MCVLGCKHTVLCIPDSAVMEEDVVCDARSGFRGPAAGELVDLCVTRTGRHSVKNIISELSCYQIQ